MMQTGEPANYLLIWCDSFFNSYSDILRKTSTLDFNSCFFLMAYIGLKKGRKRIFPWGKQKLQFIQTYENTVLIFPYFKHISLWLYI